MKNWYKIPINSRMELLKEYRNQGYSYRDAIDDFENSYKSYGNGGELTLSKPINYSNNQVQEIPSSTRVSTRNPQLDLQVLERNILKQDLLSKASQGDSDAETKFRDIFGTSTHRYRYDTDPNYKQQVDKDLRDWKGSKIDYPANDTRRKDTVPYNMRWMYPQLTDESQKVMGNFSNEVIGSALPIPLLESMGKIPSAMQVAKKASKVINKVDDVVKYYHGGLGDEIKTIDDIDLFRTSVKQNKKGRDYSGFYLYDEAEKAGATTYAEQTGKNLHEFSIAKNAKIKELPNIERLTKQDLQKYLDEGYDMIKGTDVRGRQEFVLLNKEKVISVSSSKPSKPFKSEIDWAKWNPETPKYPELINEYNAIEESTKKAGTWMKNPDGSAFKGTSEQFIQQQSNHFKKAFPEGVDKTYRGDFKHFPELDYNPIFTGDEALARQYTKNNADYWTPFHEQGAVAKGNIPNSGGLYELYYNPKRVKINIDAKNQDFIGKFIDPSTGRVFESTDDIARAIASSDKDAILTNIYDNSFHPGTVRIINHNLGSNNFMKSARGNVGFFDMTNPNIYKGLVPPIIGLGVGSQYLQEKEFGGLIPTEPLKRRRRR